MRRDYKVKMVTVSLSSISLLPFIIFFLYFFHLIDFLLVCPYHLLHYFYLLFCPLSSLSSDFFYPFPFPFPFHLLLSADAHGR